MPENAEEGAHTLHEAVSIYSRISIARTRIARIPDRSNTLADSMFRFFAILNSYYCCGAIFTSQNCPKCEFNSHFGQFRLVKMVPTTSSYRSLTVFKLNRYISANLYTVADVVRRPRASGRSSDFSSSVRMERYQSMPSSMTGTDFSRSVTSPRDASGPTSLGYTSTRSRFSGDDDDDIVVGSRINPNSSPTSVGPRSSLLRSLSSDHTSSGGRSERSLQATTASTRSHMTSSSQSGARVTKANTESHMTQSHLTSSSQSRATASTGSHMNQSHLTSSSQSGATATTRSTGTPHTQGRPLPSTPKSPSTKF